METLNGIKPATELSVDIKDDKQKGICRIKPEYIIEELVRETDSILTISDDKPPEDDDNDDEPPRKKSKREKRKEKSKGQNKQRPPPFRTPKAQNLCPWLVDQVSTEPEKKCPTKNCQFLHDRTEYMKTKEPDISPDCYVFNLTGRCPRGAACRFGSKHLTEDGINIIDSEKYEKHKGKPAATKNQIASSLQDKLRKRQYSFSKCEKIMRETDEILKEKRARMDDSAKKPVEEVNDADKTEEKVKNSDKTAEKRIGPETDEIFKEKRARMDDSAKKPAEEVKDSDKNEEKLKNSDKTAEKRIGPETDEILKEKRARMDDSAEKPAEKIKDSDKNEEKVKNSDKTAEKRIGPVLDTDLIKLRPSEKKTIDWREKLLLSPLTTVGNLPFRRICKEYGADITCGEMALAPKLLKAASEEWALVKRYETEDIFGVQICGNNTGVLSRSAQLLNEQADIDFVDLNLGCPIELIYKQGGGSGMLNRRNVLESVVMSVSQILDVPLTIKTRMGVYQEKPVAHNLVPMFRDWGASMVTVHGRSREQRYTKSADWEYIERCAAAAKPVSVFGNGDVLGYDDYLRVRESCPSVQGVTIGRGALIKPWIFTEIKERKLIDMGSRERLEILRKYANYGMDHWGSDSRGVETTRKFMLEWISFLHRYIPVGILESPPQRINERPPYYKGRDEMETLMASSNCADWVKISEMFLGKVPDGFHFLPKHKANSWK